MLNLFVELSLDLGELLRLQAVQTDYSIGERRRGEGGQLLNSRSGLIEWDIAPVSLAADMAGKAVASFSPRFVTSNASSARLRGTGLAGGGPMRKVQNCLCQDDLLESRLRHRWRTNWDDD